jgi:hypothetical protein
MKQVLVEVTSEDELKILEAFIKEHNMKGFMVEDSKATDTDVWSDVIRVLIPII